MMQRIGVSGHQFRIFLPSEAIALGWALRGSCNACAHRLVACARWLVPEAQRFLVHRTGSHSSLLHRMQPLRVVAGLLIVLVLLGSLDFVTRATVRRSPDWRRDLFLNLFPSQESNSKQFHCLQKTQGCR